MNAVAVYCIVGVRCATAPTHTSVSRRPGLQSNRKTAAVSAITMTKVRKMYVGEMNAKLRLVGTMTRPFAGMI